MNRMNMFGAEDEAEVEADVPMYEDTCDNITYERDANEVPLYENSRSRTTDTQTRSYSRPARQRTDVYEDAYGWPYEQRRRFRQGTDRARKQDLIYDRRKRRYYDTERYRKPLRNKRIRNAYPRYTQGYRRGSRYRNNFGAFSNLKPRSSLGPKPSFSKEQNITFVNGLIGLALLALAITFIVQGKSAFTGVTLVILIMYVLNFFTTSNKRNK